jgi:phospholipid/cholesterol/gamma-HCH transport system substrate-binding protein
MSNTAKVGAFMVTALVVLAVLVFKIEDLRLWGSEGQRVEAEFDSVAGLDDKAAVRVAGVRVGRVDGIRLEGGRAVVGLLLEEPLVLRQGSVAMIRSLGLLGDKFVELSPGEAAGPPMADGARLPGKTPIAWDDAMAQLSELGSSLGETLSAFDPKESGETIARLLANLETTSATVQSLVGLRLLPLRARPRRSRLTCGCGPGFRSPVRVARDARRSHIANVHRHSHRAAKR